ncbi:hypothetical protein SAMD00023353_6500230 [Rosellinia necatrix]|uniref:Uncharacterized protein n=1 Tax=Rosellinia necatrix TaxID=77044 RepID=A0A1S8ABI2_ROSNE|nr:hypothetical protein SAMD00023353_6500230 [Rosellinia necatrix]
MFTQSFQQQGPTANDNTGLVESPVSIEPIAQHVGEDPQILIQNMTESEFNQHLQNYPGYVRDVYEEFEVDRFKRIPGRLSNLCKGTQRHLTRDEVPKMDRWMQ